MPDGQDDRMTLKRERRGVERRGQRRGSVKKRIKMTRLGGKRWCVNCDCVLLKQQMI